MYFTNYIPYASVYLQRKFNKEADKIMSVEVQAQKMQEMMAKFIAHTGKKLPDDVIAKLQELRAYSSSG